MNINLENNYILDLQQQNNNEIKTIQEIRWKDVKKEKQLIVKIDFNTFNLKEFKKILRKFQRLKEKTVKHNLQIGNVTNNKTIIGYIANYNDNDVNHNNFIVAINCILYPNKYAMYNRIYDYVCDYLDEQFYKKNLCDFNNDRCGAKVKTNCTVGCCRHYRNKTLGPYLINNKLVVCEYLKDKRCTAKCISCKLFTCDYLQKKGIKFRIKDIFLLNTFFNPIQKMIIKIKVFTKKEDILKLLLKY